MKNDENIEEDSRFPHGAQLRGRGGTSRPLPLSSAHQGDTSVFLSLVCIIMASQRALLVVYLVSLVYVRSAKCLGREEVTLGWGGGGRGGTSQSAQTLKLPYIHGDQVKTCLGHPPPPRGAG